ncbi:MAG TPA: acyl-CoA desaturase [Alphaproteobacteria bacterium]|jgi:linoleoyl-CoA desaturase
MYRSEARIKFEERRQGAFFAEVKKAAAAYFAATGHSRYATPGVWLKGGFYAALAAGGYCAILGAFGGSLAAVALGYAVLGLASLALAFNLAHDASHFVLARRRWINRTVHEILFALMGVSGYLWQMRHVGSHHVFPNVPGCDADIDDNGIVRLAPHAAWRPRHRFQHLYAPLLYPLATLHTMFVQDFVYLFKRRLANMLDIRHSPAQVAIFFAGKGFHFGLVLAVPLMLSARSTGEIVACYFLMSALVSMAFVYVVIGTHIADEASFPEVGPGGRIAKSWAQHAVEASIDWVPNSRIAAFLLGGFNSHVTHHLFPTVSYAHYLALTPMVQAAARRHGLKYTETTFPGVIRAHFRMLRLMGREPGAHVVPNRLSQIVRASA